MDERIRAWRVVRIAAIGAVLLGCLSLPIGLVGHDALGLGSVDSASFRRLVLGSLGLIPLGLALFMLSQRRLLQAALLEPRTPNVDTSLASVGLRGGALAVGLRVSYPLARIDFDRRRISIRMLGKLHFTCERNEVTSIAPQRWLLGSGITIQAHSPARTAVFWALDPVAIVRALRRANYPL